MDKVELGKIVKLHGYLGGVKVRTNYDKDLRYELNKVQPWQKEKSDTLKESNERLIEENIKLNQRIGELEEELEKLSKDRDEIRRKYIKKI